MVHTSSSETPLPLFLTAAQAAAVGRYTIKDIHEAIASGYLIASDPNGKGPRIHRDTFIGWMNACNSPKWESSEWGNVPTSFLEDPLRHAPHPSDTFGEWVSLDEVVCLRIHRTQDLLEITTSRPVALPTGALISLRMRVDNENSADLVLQLVDVCSSFFTKWLFKPVSIEVDEIPSGCIMDLSPIRRRLGGLQGLEGLPEFLANKKVSKILGSEIAVGLGIHTPNSGDYRRIADAMRDLGWKSKRINKGLAFFAPTLQGSLGFHLGGAQ